VYIILSLTVLLPVTDILANRIIWFYEPLIFMYMKEKAGGVCAKGSIFAGNCFL
jgi:hypothetical protein